MDGWKRRDWNLSSGGPVKNKEDFIELDEAMKGMPVKWVSIGGVGAAIRRISSSLHSTTD